MPRLFVALRPPAAIRAALASVMDGVAVARWQDDDQLHLTVRFLGDLDRRATEDVVAALGQVTTPALQARLAGVGAFETGGRITTLWAGLAPREPLAALHRKVERGLILAGVAPDRRAYLPHVTLARLSRGAGLDPAIGRWRADNAALTSAPFALDRLILFESTLGREGARYDPVAIWPLAPGRPPVD